MTRRSTIVWAALLLAGLGVRAVGSTPEEGGEAPRLRPCRRWVQVDPPRGPLACLDQRPAAALVRRGVSRRCADDPGWVARLRPGDAVARGPAPCRVSRLDAARLALLELPVDLARGDATELAPLPGVGPGLAARIVARRTASGGFRQVEDLLAVRGIGPGLLRRLRGRVLPLIRDPDKRL
jgi:hypothetical protein